MFTLIAAAACTLGAEVTNVSDRMRQEREIPAFVAGAIVRLVRINGPASKAGIQAGDVIQAVGNHLIQNVCGFEKEIAAKTACGDVGFTIRRGTATIEITAKLVPDSKKSLPHFDDKEACANGVPEACTALGMAHKAVDLFKKGCDLGDAEGCYLFAVNLGEEDPQARGAYRQACDDGYSLACTNLGYMLQVGHGGRADEKEAVELYRRGCAGSSCSGPNYIGCTNLARMIRDGVGVKKDPAEAQRIFRDVCDKTAANDDDARNIARSCSLAGTALLGKDMPQALALLEKGCNAKDNFGCFNLGVIYHRGEVVKEDLAKAKDYYKKACDLSDEEACQLYAKFGQ